MRLRLALILLGMSLVARADGRQRHIYVEPLSEGDVALVFAGVSDVPVGVVAEGEVLSPPRGGARREDEALLAATPGRDDASAPAREMRPDRMTGTVTATDYFEAFTPAVAPYKRSIAYDAVRLDPDGTPVLVVGDETPQPVPILGSNPPRAGIRDAFWGTAMVDFRRGASVPIPSVAGDARILHIRSEPAIDFALETDSAGNFYAHALEPGAGIVRLTYLTDAARGFFQREVPSQRTDALASRVAHVPAPVREKALRFAASLGLTPSTPAATTLDRLVEHFRSFVESDELPVRTGDVFMDLATGGVGVCRHRAYAFVVTALSLSMPARFVQNEAHAWVEVELRDGWLRIDLGGSATAVNAHGLMDRPKHSIAAPDPFPQPEIFVRDYLGRGVAPLESRAATESRAPAQGESAAVTQAPVATEEAQDPSAQSSDQRTSSRLALERSDHQVYRGQMLELSGNLVDDDSSPIEGGRVEVRVSGGRLLGVALTGADGRFALAIGIPPDLGIGRYELEIGFVGDSRHRPAFAP